MTHFWRVLVLTCCSNTQLCSYNTLELTTRQKCVIYEDKPKTRQERVLHNTPKCVSKQHTKSVLFVQHARKQDARKQDAKNITRQYRVQHTFAVSTTRTKVRVVSTRLQHVKISSVCYTQISSHIIFVCFICRFCRYYTPASLVYLQTLKVENRNECCAGWLYFTKNP